MGLIGWPSASDLFLDRRWLAQHQFLGYTGPGWSLRLVLANFLSPGQFF